MQSLTRPTSSCVHRQLLYPKARRPRSPEISGAPSTQSEHNPSCDQECHGNVAKCPEHKGDTELPS